MNDGGEWSTDANDGTSYSKCTECLKSCGKDRGAVLEQQNVSTKLELIVARLNVAHELMENCTRIIGHKPEKIAHEPLQWLLHRFLAFYMAPPRRGLSTPRALKVRINKERKNLLVAK